MNRNFKVGLILILLIVSIGSFGYLKDFIPMSIIGDDIEYLSYNELSTEEKEFLQPMFLVLEKETTFVPYESPLIYQTYSIDAFTSYSTKGVKIWVENNNLYWSHTGKNGSCYEHCDCMEPWGRKCKLNYCYWGASDPLPYNGIQELKCNRLCKPSQNRTRVHHPHLSRQ